MAAATLEQIDQRLTLAVQARALRAQQGNLDACLRLTAYLDSVLDQRLALTATVDAHANDMTPPTHAYGE